ncbi:MAG: hypothetical protein WCK02_16935 [Bacteroidota bacterium]
MKFYFSLILFLLLTYSYGQNSNFVLFSPTGDTILRNCGGIMNQNKSCATYIVIEKHINTTDSIILISASNYYTSGYFFQIDSIPKDTLLKYNLFVCGERVDLKNYNDFKFILIENKTSKGKRYFHNNFDKTTLIKHTFVDVEILYKNTADALKFKC